MARHGEQPSGLEPLPARWARFRIEHALPSHATADPGTDAPADPGDPRWGRIEARLRASLARMDSDMRLQSPDLLRALRESLDREPPDDSDRTALDLVLRELEFEVFFESESRRIRGYVRARVREPHVDDVVADAWLQIRRALRGYDPARGSFGAYAFRCVEATVQDYYRGRRGLRSREIDVGSLGEEGQGRIERLAAPVRIPETSGERNVASRDVPGRANEGQGSAGPIADDPRRTDVEADIVRITLDGGSPPHQLIAFLLSRVVVSRSASTNGDTTDIAAAAVTGRDRARAKGVAAMFSPVTLRELERRIESSFVDESRLAPWRVRELFAGLRDRLELPVAKALTARRSLAQYAHLHEGITGDTALADWYPAGRAPEACISRWCGEVVRRVANTLRRQAHTPLRRKLQKRGLEPPAHRETGRGTGAGHDQPRR